MVFAYKDGIKSTFDDDAPKKEARPSNQNSKSKLQSALKLSVSGAQQHVSSTVDVSRRLSNLNSIQNPKEQPKLILPLEQGVSGYSLGLKGVPSQPFTSRNGPI